MLVWFYPWPADERVMRADAGLVSDKTTLWTFTGVCFVFGHSILIDHRNDRTGTGTDSGNPTV